MVAFLKAAQQGVELVARLAHLDLARLEIAVRERDHGVLFRAGIDHRLLRDGQVTASTRVDQDGDVGLGSELQAGVGELGSHADPACLRVDLRVDEGDPSLEGARRVSLGKLDLGLLADMNERRFVLEDAADGPDPRQVGDLERCHFRRQVLARKGHALQDDAIEGCVEHQGLAYRARPLQLLDVLFRDVPEL